MMLPRLIQGGMGVGVSGWRLAREVSVLGQLGVVSGTALETILIRRLALGDPGGHMRRAMSAFPAPEVAQRVLARYFRACDASGDASAGGANDDQRVGRGSGAATGASRFKLATLPGARLTRDREWLIVLANFVEVYLAKGGHGGVVGINYLHKIQFPTLPSLYGAMLAGVDVVLLGAGIPGEIPGTLDRLSRNEEACIGLDVQDAGDERYRQSFDPRALWSEAAVAPIPTVLRPRFFAIIASVVLAKALMKAAPGGIDGFVIEAPIAGGHNAPPRGLLQLSHRGEPIYGERDVVDMAQMRRLGVPFWLAGGYATCEKFLEALDAGASGVQIGTAFAFCEESGLDPELRRRFLAGVARGEGDVFTDPLASPTSFPFKVAALDGTLSDRAAYKQRTRLCDLGYLRRAYRKADGSVGYRCPGEPVDDYVRKGGRVEDTIGRKCLCNALVANIGLGQKRADGYEELPLLTAGNDLECLSRFVTPGRLSYHARGVIDAILPDRGEAPDAGA